MISHDFRIKLTEQFAQRVQFSSSYCASFGEDESPYAGFMPEAVIQVVSQLEVIEVVKLCHQFSVPIVARGAGSSLEGQVLPIKGGVVLDMTVMNQVIAFHPEDAVICVEPGMTREAINAFLKGSGLFFPIDPGANATIGGMCATRASGTNAVRYGTIKEQVLGLTVVLASGAVMTTGSSAKKSAAGYDLTRLMIGSEGTLGIITAITLRLFPLPSAIAAATCFFESVGDAVACASAVIQCGIPVARCELLDDFSVRAVNRYSQTVFPEKPMLLFEFDGIDQSEVQKRAEVVEQLTQDYGGSTFAWAIEPEARNALWLARHKAYYAVLQLQPGSRSVTTDVCVPISQLARCVAVAQNYISQSGLNAFILGHVGDGNFHACILIDPNNPRDTDKAEQINQAIVKEAIACGGTCTGEHGIGLHKQQFLLEEVGEIGVEMMREIKNLFDPQGILNPGKIFFEKDRIFIK